MIKRDWVKPYAGLPPSSERLTVVQSWDTASKGGPENDWSVCSTWLRTRGAACFLLDVWRRRVDYPALKANAIALAKQWKATRVLIEDTGAGTALIQELRAQVPGVVGVTPEGDR